MSKQTNPPTTATTTSGEMPKLEAKTQLKQEFKILSIDLIDDPEIAMRSDITPDSVMDLILSIKQTGLIEPIVVKPKDDRYVVIAGHRRKFAHEVAKIPTIACYVRHVTDEEAEVMKIHENLYREDIKPSDEARHFENLMKVYKISPQKIASMVKKSDSYVHDRLNIFQYPQSLRKALDDGKITFTCAREFFRLGDEPTINRFTFYAVRNGMTAGTAKKWVDDEKAARERAANPNVAAYQAQETTQSVEAMTQCIYCAEQLKLLEAVVVYMHAVCQNEALKNLQQEE